MRKLNDLKKFLQENYPRIQAFNTRNLVGDSMTTVYDKDDIQVDYCANYDYIEIFGLTDEEFNSLLSESLFHYLRTFDETEF